LKGAAQDKALNLSRLEKKSGKNRRATLTVADINCSLHIARTPQHHCPYPSYRLIDCEAFLHCMRLYLHEQKAKALHPPLPSSLGVPYYYFIEHYRMAGKAGRKRASSKSSSSNNSGKMWNSKKKRTTSGSSNVSGINDAAAEKLFAEIADEEDTDSANMEGE
jgi:hypothetical protein